MVFVFIEILFKILLFKGGVLIYAEHCIYIWVVTWIIQYGFNNPFLFLLNLFCRNRFGSVRDFRAQIIWFSSGLQSANHLIKFGTSERRAQIIWFSSGLQSANHLIKFGTSERRAQIIWFSSGLQSAERMCVYVYILYMRYQKGQICLLKHVSKYI